MTCAVETCDRAPKTRGWCEMHYARWRRLGTPLLKRRRRGVLDAPVVYKPKVSRPKVQGRKICGLTKGQFAVLVTLAKGVSEPTEIARQTGQTHMAVVRHVSSIREVYGWEAIETVIPAGQHRGIYVLGDDLLEAVWG